MGLAPYGEPKYAQTILDNLIDVKSDGSFRMDQTYFNYRTGLTMTNRRFDVLFGGPPRNPEEQLEQRHMDLAASVQAVTEEVMLRITRALAQETGQSNLCLAGGVALNCVGNGKVLRDGAFENIWVQPAAGDSGGALGAALTARYHHLGHKRITNGKTDAMRGAYLGPGYTQSDTEQRLPDAGAIYSVLSDKELVEQTAQALADEKGRLMQGRRSLGPAPSVDDLSWEIRALHRCRRRSIAQNIARASGPCTFGAKRRRGRLVRTEGRQPLYADGC